MFRTLRRSAAALATTALGLSLLTACGGDADATSGASGSLSSVTLKVGDTSWARFQAVLKYAHLDDTPYKVKWSVFQGGDLQLQAVRADALDVASSSEIPPVFAAADGKANFKVAAVMKSNTLLQEVVAPKGSKITSIAQLKGQKVGYVKNTTAHYATTAVEIAVRLLGNPGLSRANPLERHYRDIQCAPVHAPQDDIVLLTLGKAALEASEAGAR